MQNSIVNISEKTVILWYIFFGPFCCALTKTKHSEYRIFNIYIHAIYSKYARTQNSPARRRSEMAQRYIASFSFIIGSINIKLYDFIAHTHTRQYARRVPCWKRMQHIFRGASLTGMNICIGPARVWQTTMPTNMYNNGGADTHAQGMHRRRARDVCEGWKSRMRGAFMRCARYAQCVVCQKLKGKANCARVVRRRVVLASCVTGIWQ